MVCVSCVGGVRWRGGGGVPGLCADACVLQPYGHAQSCVWCVGVVEADPPFAPYTLRTQLHNVTAWTHVFPASNTRSATSTDTVHTATDATYNVHGAARGGGASSAGVLEVAGGMLGTYGGGARNSKAANTREEAEETTEANRESHSLFVSPPPATPMPPLPMVPFPTGPLCDGSIAGWVG